VKRRAFLQLMLTAAALASTKPLRAAAEAVLPEPEPKVRPLYRVRRDDGATIDVYPDPRTGVADTGRLADFRGDGNGYLDGFYYDQSGHGRPAYAGPMHRWNPRSEPEQEIGYVVCGQSNMTEGPLEPGGPNRHERRKQARLQR
jgi:hypothetical protein